jgi:hypothetical protein
VEELETEVRRTEGGRELHELSVEDITVTTRASTTA